MSVRGRPWLFVTWCDDIRQEVGNKPSFMGVYTGGLVVPLLPIVLPKLCAHAQIYLPAAERAKSLKIRVERSDGLVLAEADVDNSPMFEKVERRPDSTEDPMDLPPMFGISAALMMGGVALAEDTKHLRIFIEVDGATYPSFRLHVNVASSAPGSQPPVEGDAALVH